MNLRRIIALTAGIFAMLTVALAQSSGSLTVVLTDSQSGEPVGFATISITKAGSEKPYKYALSNAEGKAIIEKANSGKYNFKAEIMGYKPYTAEIEMTGNLDLGTVKMEPDQRVLDAASVSAAGNPIIVKKDTIEYNASSFKTNDNDMLEDLLKKLPGVEVNSDGSVTANGETITKITIDGKTFFLDDPQLASKNLPAKMIEKVKVVQKKSEQAAFTGIDDGQEETIIDLSVQKGMMNGLIGNLSAGIGHDILEHTGSEIGDDTGDWRYQSGGFIGRFGEDNSISLILNANNTNNRGFNDISGGMMGGMMGGGMRGGMGGGMGFGGGGGMGFGGGAGITKSKMAGLNATQTLFDDKMEIGGNYVYNDSNTNSLERSIKRTHLEDDNYIIYKNGVNDPGFSVNNTYGNRFGLRLEHEFSKNTSILFQPQISFGGGDYNQFSDFETYNESAGALTKTNQGFSSSNGENKNVSTNGFFLFRQRLGLPGRTLSFNANYSFSNNEMNGFNQSLTETYMGSITNQDIVNQRIDQLSRNASLTGRLVYTEPLGAGFYASANYSYSWSQNRSDKDAYNSGETVVGANSMSYSTVGETRDETYSSSILNKYNNQSAGLDLQYQNDKLRAQIGFSVLPTKTHNETNGKEYDSNVTNWAPSAMLMYDINDNTNTRIFYRGQSSQPSTSQLMPVPDNSNPLSISLGNPGLIPYFNHNMNIEFRRTNKKTFSTINLRLNGGMVQDPIVNALWYDQKGVQYSMPVNGPASKNGSARLNFSSPISKSNFSVSLNSNTNYSQSSSYMGKSNLDMSKYMNDEGVFTKYEDFFKDYPDMSKTSNFTERKTNTLGLTERLRLTYRNDAIEVILGGRTRMNKSWYSFEGAKNTLTWNNGLDGSIDWTLPGGFTFETEAEYNWYRGYETPQDPECIINLDLQKLLFKNRVTLAVRAYDILNQAKNLRVVENDNYHQETWNNTLGRYVIVALTWRFGTFGKRGSRMGMGGPMGGPGMGGPMGGGRGGRGGGMPPMGMPPMM